MCTDGRTFRVVISAIRLQWVSVFGRVYLWRNAAFQLGRWNAHAAGQRMIPIEYIQSIGCARLCVDHH